MKRSATHQWIIIYSNDLANSPIVSFTHNLKAFASSGSLPNDVAVSFQFLWCSVTCFPELCQRFAHLFVSFPITLLPSFTAIPDPTLTAFRHLVRGHYVTSWAFPQPFSSKQCLKSKSWNHARVTLSSGQRSHTTICKLHVVVSKVCFGEAASMHGELIIEDVSSDIKMRKGTPGKCGHQLRGRWTQDEWQCTSNMEALEQSMWFLSRPI